MGHKEKDLLTPSLVCAKPHLTFLLYSYKGRALVLPQLGMGMESRLVGGGSLQVLSAVGTTPSGRP